VSAVDFDAELFDSRVMYPSITLLC